MMEGRFDAATVRRRMRLEIDLAIIKLREADLASLPRRDRRQAAMLRVCRQRIANLEAELCLRKARPSDEQRQQQRGET